MIHFRFSDKDPRLLFLKPEDNIDYQNLIKLQEYLNQVDPICYLPSYEGEPFTQDFLYEYKQSSEKIIFYCSIGLWHVIYRFFKKENIEFDGLDQNRFKRKLPHSFEEFKKIVESWNLSKSPRPYQYESAYKILQWKQSVSELATRAGKTLISYMIFRYAMEYLGVKRILMVVPSVDLVKQGFNDFKEYADFFHSECLWSGGKVVESSNLTIATFQTLVNYLNKESKKYNPHFFDQYDCLFVDETHRATALSVKTILQQPFIARCKMIFGMTGTLPKESIPMFTVHALLGARIQTIEAKELMDQGYISKVKIQQHFIKYKDPIKTLDTWIRCAEYSLSEFDEVPNKDNPRKRDRIKLENPDFLIAFKKTLPQGIVIARNTINKIEDKTDLEKKLLYKKSLENMVTKIKSTNLSHIEMMMVHFFDERIDYLIDILRNDCINGNTLILAEHREYIKHVHEKIKKAFPDRKVLCVIGGSKDRKTVKEQLATEKDAILVAGYKLMSTGITLPNLHYGVLFESYKADSLITQSIGRGLGLVEGKEEYTVYDIVDCFKSKYASQKIAMQGKARQEIYENRKYPYRLTESQI